MDGFPHDTARLYYLYADKEQKGYMDFNDLLWTFMDQNTRRSKNEAIELFQLLRHGDENKIMCNVFFQAYEYIYK